MAQTKIYETNVYDDDFISPAELEVRMNAHLTAYHGLVNNGGISSLLSLHDNRLYFYDIVKNMDICVSPYSLTYLFRNTLRPNKTKELHKTYSTEYDSGYISSTPDYYLKTFSLHTKNATTFNITIRVNDVYNYDVVQSKTIQASGELNRIDFDEYVIGYPNTFLNIDIKNTSNKNITEILGLLEVYPIIVNTDSTLIGRWNFDNLSYFGEDISTKDNNLTNYGTVQDTTTKYLGNASSYFNGSSAYMKCSETNEYTFTNGLSFSCFIKNDNSYQNEQTIFNITSDSSSKYVSAGLDNLNQYIVLHIYLDQLYTVSIPYSTFPTFDINEWNFICIRISDTGVTQIVINDNSYMSVHVPIPVNTEFNTLTFGKNNNNDKYYKGWLDQPRIYSRILNNAEVSKLKIEGQI